jgi:hypothetical protein
MTWSTKTHVVRRGAPCRPILATILLSARSLTYLADLLRTERGRRVAAIGASIRHRPAGRRGVHRSGG